MAYKVRSQDDVKALLDFMETSLKVYAGLRSRTKNPVVKAVVGAILELLLQINDHVNSALEWAGKEGEE